MLKIYVQAGQENICFQGVLTRDEDRTPRLRLYVDNPVAAIALSIDIARKFTAHRGSACQVCGKTFEQKSRRGIVCSVKCQNTWYSRRRREKIKALLESESRWNDLSEERRGHMDKWLWISIDASDKLPMRPKIDPAWAKREVERATTAISLNRAA